MPGRVVSEKNRGRGKERGVKISPGRGDNRGPTYRCDIQYAIQTQPQEN